jgi:ABC-type multidrug transport system fused ATPase/permease subunit
MESIDMALPGDLIEALPVHKDRRWLRKGRQLGAPGPLAPVDVPTTPAGTRETPDRVLEPLATQPLATQPLATLEGRNISAWFGSHQVLDRVSLTMPAGEITSLIGPSGCGKSTFLRILNRMHELIPSASLAGEVLLDGEDIYDPERKLVDARKSIGMVFQKPNPFPAMSIYENVVAGLKLTGTKVSSSEKDYLVESCLTKAGLWKEVQVVGCLVVSSSVSASHGPWRSRRGCF